MKAVKIGVAGVCVLGALVAWAPVISDVMAGAQCNQGIISAFTVLGGVLGLAVLTCFGGLIARHATGKRNMKGELIDDEGVWLMFGGAGMAAIAVCGLLATSIAATVIAYTTPAAWPSTLSGMLMVHSGVAPSALVGQEVFGTTFGFLGLSSLLLTIAVLLYNLPDCSRQTMHYSRY